MKILLVSTQDYIHHPIPSRHHYIFEELARRHEVHVAHFHVSRGETRPTRLIVEEATQFPVKNPLLHYTLNAPYHYYIFNKIIRDNQINVVVASHVLAGAAVISAANKYRVPVVFDLKDWFPDSAAAYFKNRFVAQCIRKGVWEITRRNLAHSNRITTVSPSLVDKLKRLGFSADLITNGVNTELFVPQDGSQTRHELGIGTDDFVIGFSGSVEHWYAIDEMIRALPELIWVPEQHDTSDCGRLAVYQLRTGSPAPCRGSRGIRSRDLYRDKTLRGTPTVYCLHGRLHDTPLPAPVGQHCPAQQVL